MLQKSEQGLRGALFVSVWGPTSARRNREPVGHAVGKSVFVGLEGGGVDGTRAFGVCAEHGIHTRHLKSEVGEIFAAHEGFEGHQLAETGRLEPIVEPTHGFSIVVEHRTAPLHLGRDRCARIELLCDPHRRKDFLDVALALCLAEVIPPAIHSRSLRRFHVEGVACVVHGTTETGLIGIQMMLVEDPHLLIQISEYICCTHDISVHGMATTTRDLHFEAADLREHGTGRPLEHADRHIRPHMEAEGPFDMVEHTRSNRILGARIRALLAPLPEEAEVPVHIHMALCDGRERSEEHGAVGVVPAGVHDAGVPACVKQASCLLNRKRVEIGTKNDEWFAGTNHHVDHKAVLGIPAYQKWNATAEGFDHRLEMDDCIHFVPARPGERMEETVHPVYLLFHLSRRFHDVAHVILLGRLGCRSHTMCKKNTVIKKDDNGGLYHNNAYWSRI